MIIKQKAEDFIVREINPLITKEKNKFNVYLMTKINIGTQDAIDILSKITKTKFTYSGMKDKIAITSQFISTPVFVEELTIHEKDYSIILKFAGYSPKPLSLGSHTSNYFEIAVDVYKEPFKLKEFGFPNYFGEQRFSNHNIAIGKALLRKDFPIACKLLDTDAKYGKYILEHLEKTPNDYIGALKKIPQKILRLYLASVQSYYFNKELSKKIVGTELLVANQKLIFAEHYDDSQIMLPGWNTDISDEEICSQDFLFRQIPELSLEGELRNAYTKASNINYDGRIISFTLPKGSYATIFLRTIFLENIN